jgi:hypothetical protein
MCEIETDDAAGARRRQHPVVFRLKGQTSSSGTAIQRASDVLVVPVGWSPSRRRHARRHQRLAAIDYRPTSPGLPSYHFEIDAAQTDGVLT